MIVLGWIKEYIFSKGRIIYEILTRQSTEYTLRITIRIENHEPRNSWEDWMRNGYSYFFFSGTKAKTGNHGWLTIHPARFFLFFVEELSLSPPLCSSPLPETTIQEAILTTVWRVSVSAVTSGSLLLRFQEFPVHFLRKWSLFILTPNRFLCSFLWD